MDNPTPSDALDRRLLLGAAGLAGIAALSVGRAKAGPLSPPAGAVASTGKTFTEVEPRTAINATNTPGDANSLYKITQPGSYYLTGNITGVSGKHGIELGVSGGGVGSVTLDLNGFELVGVPGSLNGIYSPASVGSLCIRGGGGTVRNWGGEGVTILNSNGACGLADVRSASNGGSGFSLTAHLLITNCVAYNNGGLGFSGAAASTLSGCTAMSNTLAGFNMGTGVNMEGCTAAGNGGIGIEVFAATLRGCSSYDNGAEGLYINSGSSISNCAVSSNAGAGIRVFSGCSITDCVSTDNGAEGILATSSVLIRGNTCEGNGTGGIGAGIKVTGSNNRIEGNNSFFNDFGIQTGAGGNVIAGNICSGNTTNWVITTNNYYGAIIDRTGVATAAVAGNAAAGTLGSTDAHANFTV